MSVSGGFIVQDKIKLLKLDDGEFAGVEARFGSMKSGEMADMIELTSLIEIDVNSVEGAKAAGDAWRSLLGMLAQSLRGWNLKRPDGTPIPATLEEIQLLDVDLVMELVALRMSTGAVSAPLDPTSNGGASLAAPSIPMVDL